MGIVIEKGEVRTPQLHKEMEPEELETPKYRLERIPEGSEFFTALCIYSWKIL